MARLELTLTTGKVFQFQLPEETETDSLSLALLERTGLFAERWLRVDDRTLINTDCVAKVELVTRPGTMGGFFPG